MAAVRSWNQAPLLFPWMATREKQAEGPHQAMSVVVKVQAPSQTV